MLAARQTRQADRPGRQAAGGAIQPVLKGRVTVGWLTMAGSTSHIDICRGLVGVARGWGPVGGEGRCCVVRGRAAGFMAEGLFTPPTPFAHITPIPPSPLASSYLT